MTISLKCKGEGLLDRTSATLATSAVRKKVRRDQKRHPPEWGPYNCRRRGSRKAGKPRAGIKGKSVSWATLQTNGEEKAEKVRIKDAALPLSSVY